MYSPSTSQPLRRRLFNAAAVCAAVGLVGPVLQAQPRLEKDRLVVATGGRASFYHLPLALALELGYFKAEGLELEVQDFPGGSATLRALLAGTVDVASGGYEHVITGTNRGRALRAFVSQGRAPQIAVGVSTRALPDFRHLSQLRGRRVGVTAPGSSTHLVMATALLRAGLSPDDVSYVGVGSTAAALTALRTGHIDAISNVEPVISMLEHKGEVKIIVDTRTLQGTQALFGGLLPSSCLFASDDFVRQHPATCQALTNGIVRALKWLRTATPQDLLSTVPESYFLGDRGLYLLAFSKVSETFSVDGLIDSADTRTALRALASMNPRLRDSGIDLSGTYTNDFALRAKARYKA